MPRVASFNVGGWQEQASNSNILRALSKGSVGFGSQVGSPASPSLLLGGKWRFRVQSSSCTETTPNPIKHDFQDVDDAQVSRVHCSRHGPFEF